MINIKDNRTTSDTAVRYIKTGGFFMFHDVLFRRVELYDGWVEADGIPVIEMTTGIVSGLNRDAMVEPIRDEQVDISVEDWG